MLFDSAKDWLNTKSRSLELCTQIPELVVHRLELAKSLFLFVSAKDWLNPKSRSLELCTKIPELVVHRMEPARLLLLFDLAKWWLCPKPILLELCAKIPKLVVHRLELAKSLSLFTVLFEFKAFSRERLLIICGASWMDSPSQTGIVCCCKEVGGFEDLS